MQQVSNNDWIIPIIVLFIIIYALNIGKIELPCYIKNLFKNTIFRILFLSLLLVYKFEKAPYIALIIALIFVLTLDYLTIEETKENFAYLESLKTQIKNNKNKNNKKKKKNSI
jgi:predicted neutral ceramidase superfamily lipid hydrolase